MPIKSSVVIETISEDEFYSLDYKIMGIVFSIHKDFGRFYDAINYFRGGEDKVVKRIEIVNDSRILGTQRVHLLNSKIAFKISAVTKAMSFYEQNLQRFISHTTLKAIQWINFNHDKIVFTTISK